MYDNLEYAKTRLEGTIISYDGKPVKVVQVNSSRGGELVVESNDLNMRNSYSDYINRFDLTPVKLGFCNTNRGIAYLARVPMRNDWRQGLRQQNMKSLWGVDSRWANDHFLNKTILGIYPKFIVALEEIVNIGHPIAFDRNFALIKDKDKILLAYRFYGPVGDVVNEEIRLFDNRTFLQETLDSLEI